MKKLLLSVAVLFVVGLLNAQESLTENAVGIKEEHPQATLDVNGDARIQQLKDCKDCRWVLVQDDEGMVQKLPISDFTIENSVANQVGGTVRFTNISDNTVYIASFNYGGDANYQGVVNSTEIPVTITYRGAQAGQIQEKIISAEGNPSLKLKIPTTDISVGEGTIRALLYSDGNYEVPQLNTSDFNEKRYEKDVATFKVKVNGVDTPATIRVKAAGIPDRKFRVGDGKHDFVYLPVRVQVDGYDRTWLSYNLGAAYAKVGSPDFNLAKNKHGQDAHDDDKTYGSLYQWQRPSDGHEFRDSETIDMKADNWQATSPPAVVGKFIWNEYSEWKDGGHDEILTGSNKNLWQAGGENNPCPIGYHVPESAEWSDFLFAMSDGTEFSKNWFNQKFLPNLSAAGARRKLAGPVSGGSTMYYASSSVGNQGNPVVLLGDDGTTRGRELTSAEVIGASTGTSVRCIQD